MPQVNRKNMVQNIENAIADFEKLQTEQLRSLLEGKTDNLTGWLEKRSKVFANLMRQLDLVNGSGEANNDAILKRIQRKIESLLKTEKELDQAAVSMQEQISKKLSSIRKGRKALKGYGNKNCSSYHARFLSNRT